MPQNVWRRAPPASPPANSPPPRATAKSAPTSKPSFERRYVSWLLDRHAVTNPILIVEVLSQSTEDYDRGDKFEHYKRIPSLRQYVLVSHREREIEVWTRSTENDWTRAVSREGERASLESINATLEVSAVYDAAAEPPP